MRVVLDTNVILSSISPYSPYCPLAFNANYLVANDRHFRVLKNIPFPSLTVLKMEEFMEILNALPDAGVSKFTA